jgi:hypothetical protein
MDLPPHFLLLRFHWCNYFALEVFSFVDMGGLTCGLFGWPFAKGILFGNRWSLPLLIWAWGFQWSTQNRKIMLFGCIAFIEPGCRIPECYGTCQWDTLWVSYGWMKFGYFELHPLIVHASWPQWECILGSWNALWVAYKVVQSIFAYEGVLNALTLNVDFLDWLFFSYSF